MKFLFFIFMLFLMVGCKGQDQVEVLDSSNVKSNIKSNIKVDIDKSSIKTRFGTPAGFERKLSSKNSFGSYLQNFKLLADGSPVLLYNGQEKGNQNAHLAVMDIDVGKSDLQQCADAIMRLRAEHLYAQKKYDYISFNFTNSWKFDYKTWREGNSLVVQGNKTFWKASTPKTTYQDFRNYMTHVFMYAGTLSLSKELQSKKLIHINIGDILIQGGSPGHAVIVVDIATHAENGDKAFILAQSYMPAQQIHILKNPKHSESPWYFLSEIEDNIPTPEWTFYSKDLKSF